jgi:hypothetical protein
MQHGIPSALQRENGKLEVSQFVKQIHRDSKIADKWTETHSLW